jgi:hypothetical protein
MLSATLLQALSLSAAAGISPFMTIALLGFGERVGWSHGLPGSLGVLTAGPIVVIAACFVALEIAIVLIPGIGSIWETAQSAIRPLAAVAFAMLATSGHPIAVMVTSGIVGGLVGLTMHVAKLSLRLGTDATLDPVARGILGIVEVTAVSTLLYTTWHQPIVGFALAMGFIVIAVLAARSQLRSARRTIQPLFGPERRVGEAGSS